MASEDSTLNIIFLTLVNELRPLLINTIVSFSVDQREGRQSSVPLLIEEVIDLQLLSCSVLLLIRVLLHDVLEEVASDRADIVIDLLIWVSPQEEASAWSFYLVDV